MTSEQYNECVELQADAVFRFIYKNIKDADKARDVVQDTFEKLWTKRNDVGFEKSKSYIFTTAYHTMIDMLRKDKRMTKMDKKEYQLYADNEQYTDIQEILHSAVDKLPADQKSVILLRDYEGYSYKEISDITGLSEAQVKVYIFRARAFLKSYIGSIEAVA